MTKLSTTTTPTPQPHTGSNSLEFHSELMHQAAHDIGNQLTSIISIASLYQRPTQELSKETLEKLPFYAASISEQAWKISHFMERITTLLSSRPQTHASADAGRILQRTLRRFHTDPRYGTFPPSISQPEDLKPVRINPEQLGLLFSELLTNALEKVSSAPPTSNSSLISIFLSQNDTETTILFCSSSLIACPLPLAELTFPFVTEHPKSQHLGIGLTVAQVVANRAGGSLQLEELKQDDGFLFRVTLKLPNDSATEENSERERSAKSSLSNPFRILLIEDEPIVATAIEKIICLALAPQTRVELCIATGTDAKDLIEKSNFDVILCDLHLVGTTGQELFRWITEKHPLLKTRLGFLSGDSSKLNSDMFIVTSGQPVLKKPFEPEELLSFVTSLIRDP